MIKASKVNYLDILTKVYFSSYCALAFMDLEPINLFAGIGLFCIVSLIVEKFRYPTVEMQMWANEWVSEKCFLGLFNGNLCT